MNYEERNAVLSEGEILANIRVQSMKESLEAIGRFDPDTARNRFLSAFKSEETTVILVKSEIIGFYVIQNKEDSIYLAHLYLLPEYQNYGIGGKVIASIKSKGVEQKMKITVGALRGSKSNDFYMKNGFHKTHEDEWDLYYETRV